MTKTDRFPDTVFLPDRARLAINCLNGCVNTKHNHLPFCLTDLTGDPPRMAHTQFDWSDHTSRVIDALLLAKAMTGDAAASTHLPALTQLFDSGFGTDGLHYTPENPWSFHHANMHYQRSVLNALLSLALVEGSDTARRQGNKLARALTEISIHREGYAYFPAVERSPEGWPRGDWSILGSGVDPANTNGRLIFGLSRLAELLPDSEAGELAGAYARHVMHASSAFASDGSFATGMEFREGHFHSRAVTMLGVIRYGHAQRDASAIEWGRRVFDRALQYGTSFGWFPERLVKSRAHGCETCAIVDMMESAIWLAKCGHSQYWEHAERFLRNQLLESQVTRIDWVKPSTQPTEDSEWETTENVAQRSLGGFAGWSQPNDLVSKVMHRWDLYTCCSAQGVRGLFNAWSHATTIDKQAVSVNLLINSASEHATVRSWLPAEGRVEVTLHRHTELRIRVPSWVDPRNLVLKINGKEPASRETPHRFSDTVFVRTGPLAAGTVVEASFPVAAATTRETVLDTTYEVEWRGDTVVGISPGGTRVPLYQRQPGATTPPEMVEKTFSVAAFHL
ncbi:MAG: hypothetical protein JWQ07_1506 [Ramlibacter sp.]|nr:hypothetical protein [Ramlibacter sp.]